LNVESLTESNANVSQWTSLEQYMLYMLSPSNFS
jgi:hypothetical protein